jgi:hypothetical protein
MFTRMFISELQNTTNEHKNSRMHCLCDFYLGFRMKFYSIWRKQKQVTSIALACKLASEPQLRQVDVQPWCSDLCGFSSATICVQCEGHSTSLTQPTPRKTFNLSCDRRRATFKDSIRVQPLRQLIRNSQCECHQLHQFVCRDHRRHVQDTSHFPMR